MEHVETISVAIVIITAVWKGIEGIINYRVQKKVKQAELRTATIQAENTMLQNWVQWSQTLEKRVKEAEETIISLKDIIDRQKEKLASMERQNKRLVRRLSQIKRSRHEKQQ
ncbi:hypothetical protein GCM10009122_23350 [Fulvivirga kasyanovii]|uniref:Uncharacterized protein n=1 Tax=Fulvivirga kasyanovii TaxID=396812 RepID=A0ABW9RXG1_9BACT|nr:hypothetical protein [Fulvivirga kasyanovii]MTI28959.1 hypothetical protein [Fulvivirga kasyanovii]